MGVGTVIADNPRLTLRSESQRDRGILAFTRVVLDPNGKLASPSFRDFHVLSDGQGPTLIFTTKDMSGSGVSEQVEWINMGPSIHLPSVLGELGRRGFIQVMVEGGPTTLTHFLEQKLINRLTVFIAPKLIGNLGKPFYCGSNPGSVNSEQLQLKLESIEIVSDGQGDIRVDYTVQ